VLLLDEPTSALDPASVAAIEETVTDLTSRDRTVVLVSHDAAQARRTADHVLLIDRGRLIAHGAAEHIDYLEAGR
jgi:ABC-type phosphate transport system ATPase subunit